jgi:soluble cytochrome b562
VPQDAQDYKDELKRIQDFVLELQKKVIKECEMYSEDIKFWAEYKTGIKEFRPWLENAEKRSKEGIVKPQTLDDANALYANVSGFVKSCETKLNILKAATDAAMKMTTHIEADVEVDELNKRYLEAKMVTDLQATKIETLVKEWRLLDSTVCELNSWVAEDRKEGEQQFSLEKMESTLGELKNIFKEKEKLVENL